METVIETLISKLVDTIAAFIIEEVDIIRTAKKELEILKRNLQEIKSAVKEAEALQFFRQESIRSWMRELKGVVSDAEDVIEEYRVKTELSKRAEAPNTPMNKVRKTITRLWASSMQHPHYQRELGHSIRKINRHLNQIGGTRNILENIKETVQRRSAAQEADGGVEADKRATTSGLIKGEEIGRQEDKEELISKLLRGDVSKKRNFSVISIAGKGGLGKTYLAKMIFNDEQVKRHFDSRVWWVCVSDKPKPRDLARKMLEAIHKKAPEGATQLETLCDLLKEAVTGKKFLMILDDVWDLDWWVNDFEASMQQGASGSKFLITTRRKDLLKRVDPVYVHDLREFSFEESWRLFLSKALQDGQTKEKEKVLKENGLKDIGVSIVRKCGGLPLVVQSVGSLMRTKELDKRDWERVEKSEIWTWEIPPSSSSSCSAPSPDGDLLPGLILSYDDLQPHLKNCFVYCIVFPKDFQIRREELIQQWVAHGFVDEKEGIDIEETASDYLDELVSRCLLEKSPASDYLDEFVSRCLLEKSPFRADALLMHDVIHDLALFIAGEECSHNSVNQHTRHLSLIGKDRYRSFEQAGLESASTKLRTLLCPRFLENFPFAQVVNNLKRLRVLRLQGCQIKELPGCIGELLHLRFLDLGESKIKQLPTSIGKLYNLQSLNLRDSEIEALPKEIGELHNLRHLLFSDHLQFMPESLGKLTNLRELSRFIVSGDRGNEIGCSIKELKGLNKLKGELSIEGLERVKDGDDSEQAQLDQKSEVTTLRLIFKEADVSSAKKHEDVVERLQPPRGLSQCLEIEGYMGEKLQPSWWPECPRVKLLVLGQCLLVKTLPAMTFLKELRVSNCPAFKMLPRDFPALEELEMYDLANWEGWSRVDEAAMPSLKYVRIKDCPAFKMLPRDFPALEELEMYDLAWSRVDESAMPSLKSVWIEDCPAFKMLPHDLPALEELKMYNLTNWEGWSRVDEATMPCLKEVEIYNCPAFKMLPHDLPALQELDMKYLKNWEGWSRVDEAAMPSLKSVWIEDCPAFKMLPRDFPALKNLYMINLTNWEGWSRVDEAAMPSLKVVVVRDCPNLSRFPHVFRDLWLAQEEW